MATEEQTREYQLRPVESTRLGRFLCSIGLHRMETAGHEWELRAWVDLCRRDGCGKKRAGWND